MGEQQTADLLYGYDEIAEYLHLRTRQVQHLAEVDDSDFPTFKIGRRVCALKSRLDQWLADKATQKTVEGQGQVGEQHE